MNKCPKCGCPFIRTDINRTADMPHPWKDKDGKWYNGIAQEDRKHTCTACGHTEEEHFKRGKKE